MKQFRELLRPLQVRLANAIARAVVQLVDDGMKLQLLQLGVLAGEEVDDAEHFQGYGFSSVPLPGAEAVVLFPGGDRAHPLVIAVDDRRHRPTGGAPGEVVLYCKYGQRIRFLEDGTAEIVAGNVEVRAAEGVPLTPLDELVHGTGIDPFTGATYKSLGSTTARLRASKV